MDLSCKGAHKQYTRYLEEKQKDQVHDQKSLKRKLKQEEIMNAKRVKLDTEKAVSALRKNIDNCTMEASTKDNFEDMKLCLDQAKLYRDSLKKKEDTIAELDKAIEKLEGELKSC